MTNPQKSTFSAQHAIDHATMPTPLQPAIDVLLARIPLFSSLSEDEIARIARGTREINVV